MPRYKSDYEFISSRRLGQLKALWAPLVPADFAAALGFRESNLGQNPDAAKINSDGVKGAFQITIKPRSWQPEKETSLAEFHWPSKLGAFNADDQEHLAIAGLRKLNADWEKFKGNEYAVVRAFYGGGVKMVNGKPDTARDYYGRVKETQADLANTPRTADFIAGDAEVNAKLVTALESRAAGGATPTVAQTDTTTITQPPTAEDNYLLNLMGMGA